MWDSSAQFFADCTVDVDGPVPIYYQLQEWLGERIASGDLPAGTQLPSERECAEHLGISRMTVRQAVDRLVRDGRLERRRGQGTFVTRSRVTGDLTTLRSASSELAAQGRRSSVAVLDLQVLTPVSGIRRRLALDAVDGGCIRLRRLRSADGVPSALETSWMPLDLCRPVLAADLGARSLNEVLEEDCGLSLDRAVERLTATGLDAFEAHHLDHAVEAPAFLLERTTWEGRGRPVEYVKTVLRGDLYAFETVLEGSRLSAPALGVLPTMTTNG